MRITTNASLYTYKYNLNKTTTSLNNAMTKLMTGRNFNSYATNPAAATRAFKLHSSLNAVNTQYNNNEMILHKYETAWSTMDTVINDLSASMGQVPALEGLNETNLSNLNSQGQILRSGAEAMIHSMNGQYDGNFIFAGADTQNAPFAIDEEGFVTYRGVQIDNPDTLDDVYHDADGNPIIGEDGKEMTNQQVLDMWNEEHQYADIGLGFKLDTNGDVIDSTAFDSAISGIDVMGYGVDEDGDPKNIASIMLRLADIFEGYNQETGQWSDAGNQEDAERLLNKFNEARDAMSQKHVELDSDAKFLNSNQTQLEETFDALNVERSNLEDADPADTILELSWAQTCYSAALQAGSNIIPQSLMDYIK